MEDEICPYATFHLLGFREEMDPNKAMQFQTFPHQNGHERTHSGTIGPVGPGSMASNGHIHQRTGSQSMVSDCITDPTGTGKIFLKNVADKLLLWKIFLICILLFILFVIILKKLFPVVAKNKWKIF